MFQNIKKIYILLDSEQRRTLAFLQLLIIFMSFTEVAGVMSIGPFMSLVSDIDQIYGDNYIAKIYTFTGISDPQDFVLFSATAVVAILSFATLMNIYTIWKISMYAAKIGATLSNRLFVFYIQQPWLFHANGNSNNLVNKIVQESTRLNTLIINPFMQFSARFIMCLTMVIAIVIYNPIIAVAAIIIFLGSYLVLFFIAKNRLSFNGEVISKEQALRFKVMSEGFGGIKDTLVLGRQSSFIERFISASNAMAYATGNTNTLTLYPKYLLELLAFSGVVALTVFLIITNNGQMETVLPALAIFALAGFKILPAFQLCYSSISVIRANMSSFEILEVDLYNSSESLVNNSWDKNNFLDRMSVNKSIKLNDISFSYPNSQKLILKNISLEIQAGDFIGLVGSSGSGKSTLIDIFLGLIEPLSGNILIDDEILDSKNLRKWQNNIGVVSQSIFLADSTIMENIAFGVPYEDINEQQIISAIQLANLDEFVKTLPKGINTRVGERGLQLSGGQRQRIGIARSLYNSAGILVFDEATSSLDGVTEKKVMDAIYGLTGTKTIITIAHRLASVKKCDSIYILEEGKIIDNGSYKSLSARSNLFKKMTDLA